MLTNISLQEIVYFGNLSIQTVKIIFYRKAMQFHANEDK